MKQLALALGLKEDATEAEILQALTTMKTANATIATLQTENTRLTGLVNADNLAKTEALNARRAEVLATYGRTTATQDKKITDAIAAADLTTLAALEVTYLADLERLFPAKCGDCGSTKIKRASTKTKDEEGDQEEAEDFRDVLRDKKRKQGLQLGDSSKYADKK